MASILRNLLFWKKPTPDYLIIESADLRKKAAEQEIAWKDKYQQLDTEISNHAHNVETLFGEISSAFQALRQGISIAININKLTREKNDLSLEIKYKRPNDSRYDQDAERVRQIEYQLEYTPVPDIESLKDKLKGQIAELCKMIDIPQQNWALKNFSYISANNDIIFNTQVQEEVYAIVKFNVDNFKKIKLHDQLKHVNYSLQKAFIHIRNFEPFVRNGQFQGDRHELDSAKKYLNQGLIELEVLRKEYPNKELNDIKKWIAKLKEQTSNLIEEF